MKSIRKQSIRTSSILLLLTVLLSPHYLPNAHAASAGKSKNSAENPKYTIGCEPERIKMTVYDNMACSTESKEFMGSETHKVKDELLRDWTSERCTIMRGWSYQGKC